jgi:uncharacterized membrane protein
MNIFNVLVWVLIGCAILVVANIIDICIHDWKQDKTERGRF